MSKEFPPELRLRSKADFNSLKGGDRQQVYGLRFVIRKSNLLHARLGLAVSRKFGNAVERNRLKRVLRETFRQHDICSFPMDILVYPSTSATEEVDFSKQMSKGLDKIMALRKT
ncbi:MAG: ribonuclease P protein component [Mariprofundaceae bacterium]